MLTSRGIGFRGPLVEIKALDDSTEEPGFQWKPPFEKLVLFGNLDIKDSPQPDGRSLDLSSAVDIHDQMKLNKSNNILTTLQHDEPQPERVLRPVVSFLPTEGAFSFSVEEDFLPELGWTRKGQPQDVESNLVKSCTQNYVEACSQKLLVSHLELQSTSGTIVLNLIQGFSMLDKTCSKQSHDRDFTLLVQVDKTYGNVLTVK
ncbi:hypothetical protein DFH07DRAFT_776453 [Mycena maculata]|uniref:Uncharacterized protein n=1 Tax=Mycena maculata TaxID=230809 RepID=A0AAD7IPQ6_9AGAR|nr:hypothetical protein DFH07DRAFT_776453 [Mycena maculata]